MNNLGVILKINPDLTYNIIQIDSNAVDMNNSATLQYNYTSKFYSNDLSFDELNINTFDLENGDILDDVKFKENNEDSSATNKIHDIDNLLDSFELISYPSEEQAY